MERQDTELLIKHSKQMAEHLLIEQEGEFHPIAGCINIDGIFNYQAIFDGDEFPLSKKTISDFKALFEKRLAEKSIRAYAIAYDVRVTSPTNHDKTDAIAIFVKHAGKQPVNYFYPYSLTNNEIEFNEPWGEYVNSAK
ncbi:hypothetical protein EOD41_19750 [Mucilaginibacter limnophilus]|uniref:Uncharacterized protein n=1 Tax=Mucilaginibacter limnophilus TaxID=1932778 RepID=A0A437MFW6_9SPHI|nr:hypothetical protein [Mucilaginibacter limnophilus]RVT96548.1 hypothetical protein EOD41_19750 [Mucilaginibacter limnophilus]